MVSEKTRGHREERSKKLESSTGRKNERLFYSRCVISWVLKAKVKKITLY